MRPVVPIFAFAMLAALPAAAAGHHHHAAKSHAAQGTPGAGATANTPAALATPYDYGTDGLSTKNGAATTTMDNGKAAKASQDDLATFTGVPTSGAAKKHGRAQTLPAY